MNPGQNPSVHMHQIVGGVRPSPPRSFSSYLSSHSKLTFCISQNAFNESMPLTDIAKLATCTTCHFDQVICFPCNVFSPTSKRSSIQGGCWRESRPLLFCGALYPIKSPLLPSFPYNSSFSFNQATNHSFHQSGLFELLDRERLLPLPQERHI